jgi:Coenzyme PQQ synthesis protein D (PqqD)
MSADITDFSDSVIVTAGKEQFSCALGETVILLDMKAGLYFSLDNVGAAVWQLLQQPRTVKEIRESILDEFQVSADVCQSDLISLLRELAARNLIEIRDATAA